jgi:hypothetical protein
MDLKKQPAAINMSPSGIRPKSTKTTRTAVYAAVARTISFFLSIYGGGQVVGPLYNDSVLIVYLYCKYSHVKGPKINSIQNIID